MKLIFGDRPKKKPAEGNLNLINIGAGFDIPTSRFVKGRMGETIVVGGYGAMMGFCGRGNMFKTTILHFTNISAMETIARSRMFPALRTYETETTTVIDRLRTYIMNSRFFSSLDMDFFDEGVWTVDSPLTMAGEDWVQEHKSVLNEKIKNRRKYNVKTPFVERDGSAKEIPFPDFGQMDSISEFSITELDNMRDKNKLGDSKANPLYLRAGLVKSRLIQEFNILANKAGHYFGMTAHIGTKFEMASGPMAPKQQKDMQFMRQDEKVKNVPDQFYFLPTVVYQTTNVKRLLNDGDGLDEYQLAPGTSTRDNPDLNLITLRCIRSKVGATGWSINLVVSQSNGVLPEVTEFHNLRTNKGFGINRSGSNYSMTILPDFTFTRNGLRRAIEENPKLRTALRLTHEIWQLTVFRPKIEIYATPNYKGELPDPDMPYEYPSMDDLYKKLEEEYGWDRLLESRPYWTVGEYEDCELPFLSSVDLLEIYHGRYKPYWLNPKSEVKPAKEDK